MKIFSLENKTSLVLCGVFLGVCINYLCQKLTLKSIRDYDAYISYSGFPLHGVMNQKSLLLDKIFIINLFFWILLSFIILSLIRHFTSNKKNPDLLKIGFVLIIVMLSVLVFRLVNRSDNSWRNNNRLYNSNNDDAIRKNNPIPRLPKTDTLIPKGLSMPTSDKVIIHNGIKLVKDEIILILQLKTINPESRIKQIADETNAVITGSISETLTYQLQFNINSFDELTSIQMKLEAMKDVESANKSFLPVPLTKN